VPTDLFSTSNTEQLVSNGWTDVQAAALLAHIGREAFHASVDRDFSKACHKDLTTGERGCYGVRRIHAELARGLGIQVGRDHVELVMQRTGIRGIAGTPKRYVNRQHLITTEDLVQRNFTATAPNQLWCTDITEHPTTEGKVYCCAVIDVYSRKIVGWAIDMRQTTTLVLNALDMAVEARKPSQTVIHSDHGTQFTSWACSKRVKDAGLVGSMGTIGDGYNNAMIESFWSTMQDAMT